MYTLDSLKQANQLLSVPACQSSVQVRMQVYRRCRKITTWEVVSLIKLHRLNDDMLPFEPTLIMQMGAKVKENNYKLRDVMTQGSDRVHSETPLKEIPR